MIDLDYTVLGKIAENIRLMELRRDGTQEEKRKAFNALIDYIGDAARKAKECGFSEQDFIDAAANAYFRC